MFSINGRAFYEINCILTKLWVLMSKKYKIHENFSKKLHQNMCTYIEKLFTHTGYWIVVQ